MKKWYVLLITCLALNLYSQDRENDSLALLQIYEDLNGESWEGIDNWLSDFPLEEWEGIQIDNDRVTKVELKNASAVGVFPTSVLELTKLRTLEIRSATISGVIPEAIADLPDLSRLVLSSCGMSGELPPIFEQMTQLTTLVLDRNSFTGPLPDIHNNFFLVYINNNEFTGEVPDSWANKEIRAVQIQHNQLEGSMDIFSTWTGYTSMNLSDNNWTESTFPEWVDDNETLERFDCENCNLVGDLPASLDFSNLPNYRNMQLSENQLSGDISLLFNGPDSDEKLNLRFRNNNFSGEFPAHKVRLFSRLDVRSNHYDSMTEFGDIILESFDINYNNFNYTTLEPVKEFIALDSLIGVNYGEQNPLLGLDSFFITSPTTLTLEAGDLTEGTTYQWYKGFTMIEGETSHDFNLEINGNSDGGSYHCRMQNEDYPELELRRNTVLVDVDLSTSTNDIHGLELQLYPNPTSTFLHFRSDVDMTQSRYAISTMNGSVQLKGMVSQGEILDVSSLPQGMYILTLDNGAKRGRKIFTKM